MASTWCTCVQLLLLYEWLMYIYNLQRCESPCCTLGLYSLGLAPSFDVRLVEEVFMKSWCSSTGRSVGALLMQAFTSSAS
jgi:hypothetical protein